MQCALLLVAGTMLLAAGCASRPQNQRATLLVSMTGIQEVPGPGDPDGNGTVEIRVDPGSGEICWNLYARAIEEATAAHIHRGPAGTAGPVGAALTTPDSAGRSQGCATVDPGARARDRLSGARILRERPRRRPPQWGDPRPAARRA